MDHHITTGTYILKIRGEKKGKRDVNIHPKSENGKLGKSKHYHQGGVRHQERRLCRGGKKGKKGEGHGYLRTKTRIQGNGHGFRERHSKKEIWRRKKNTRGLN